MNAGWIFSSSVFHTGIGLLGCLVYYGADLADYRAHLYHAVCTGEMEEDCAGRRSRVVLNSSARTLHSAAKSARIRKFSKQQCIC